MLKRYIKLSMSIVLLSFTFISSNSFAGDIYGKLGYGHTPFKIVIGYDGHHKHHHYKRYRHSKHYYVPRHYRYHYKPRYGYDRHYYKPRRYCRSRY